VITIKVFDNSGLSQAIIYYLGHSSWAVKTKSHFLIFDYYEKNRNAADKSLSNGFINPAEIKGENVFVFVSHKHPDHYDNVIHTWKTSINNITYIAGWNSRGTDFVGIPPHSYTSIKDLKISTLKSTDEGSGFLVDVDGLTIFHAGDHANWPDMTHMSHTLKKLIISPKELRKLI
jgi:L-ascorbate metabolism protein UlaG (beta-lactamase superfamily)